MSFNRHLRAAQAQSSVFGAASGAGTQSPICSMDAHRASVGRRAAWPRVGAIPQPAQHRYRDSRERAAVTGQPQRESHARLRAPQLFNRHPR
jgi:hypothetical protein